MLKFTPETHTYTWSNDIVPSVTGILEDVQICDYSALPQGTRHMALDRGSHVHEAIAMETRHGIGCIEEDSITEEEWCYVRAARDFRRDYVVEVHAVESRGFHPTFRYAGTRDLQCAAKIPCGIVDSIVDYKCSYLRGKVPRWTRFQTAAYAAFEKSPRRFYRLAVALHKDATYTLAGIYTGDEWPQDFATFASFLTTYREKRECNPQIYKSPRIQAPVSDLVR